MTTLNSLLKKLIKASAGRSRFIMAVVGLSVALLLILSAVQIQMNYNDLLNSKTNQDSIANFLVINKTVTSSNVGETALTPAEIDDLKKQPFVDDVGILTASRYKLSAQGVSDQIPFYTELFFESVPDAFLDVTNKDWQWNQDSKFIPMIIPNMFLDMYNFGFATSQNLPQLSQELVMNLPVQINIRTTLGTVNYYGKVVGFSDRISSVLVPQNFMDWANEKYGEQGKKQPSRVVIRTRDAGNPQLVSYLTQHNLTTDADKTRFSKYRQIVTGVVNVSWVTGAVMLLFALLIFTLFIQLTIASCKEEIVLLVTLGAAPKQLQRFLMKQFFPPNIVIVVVVLLVISMLQFVLKQLLDKQNIYVNGLISPYTIAAGVVILTVLYLVNRFSIKKYIYQDK
ncbi:FtsX-like permease family protein [Foetidibacter luteolus]|uniref:FtsX-like permease family protein n=1 Tax=Foetidibacter luteolus TaxID=2608880 RepID=UPI00129BBB34|nr:FtsX-like permease family protein [Foetidibacter luteolus]